jgi:hypothetical protein
VKTPVFSFEAEILTNAPYEHIVGRFRSLASPADLPCLKPLRRWLPLEAGPDGLRVRWENLAAGVLEQGCLIIRPDARGAHLRLEGQMKGWMGFLLLGRLRWRTDRLLDRLVEDL